MLYALHGFTESDEVWSDVLATTQIEHRCLLLPGHGSKPCAPESDIATTASDFMAQIPEETVDLLGYSMGGRIALRMALDFPQRVKRLILISSSPGLNNAQQRSERVKIDDALAEILEEDGIGAFVAAWENHRVLKSVRPLDQNAEATLRSRRLNHDPQDLAHACRSLGQGRMEPLWDRLKEIECPVLLLAGSHDHDYKNMLQDAAELITDARFRVVPVAAHGIHREQPDALLEFINDFLSEEVE